MYWRLLLFIFAGFLPFFCNAIAEDKASSQLEKNLPSKPLPIDKKIDIKDPNAVLPPDSLFPEGVIKMGTSSYYSQYAITLDKAKRTLYLWVQENDSLKLVTAYPSDYGRKPGDKYKLGDLKTPEGIYFFQTSYTQSQLNYDEYGVRAFTMNYPNFFDKRKKKTGSGIWLHSIPPYKTLSRGSRGCIIVRIDAIEKLKEFISMDTTPILVYPEMKYVSLEQKREQQNQVLKWLDSWKQDWEGKKLENYMSYYSKDFYSKKMNKEAWRDYKEGVNSKYNYISVKVESPAIFKEKDRYVIRFLQTYTSDLHTDFGEKTLYIKQAQNGDYRILGESWKSISEDQLVALKKTDSKSLKSN